MESEHSDSSLCEEHTPNSTSWLCRDDLDRERMVDMQTRMDPGRRRAYALLTLALLISGPWLGWWPLAMVIPAVACYKTADILAPKVAHPEYVWFFSWIASASAIAGAVALTGGSRSPLLSWLAIPVLTLSSRFSMRGVMLGIAITIVVVLVIAFVGDTQAALSDPPLVIAPLALFFCITFLSTPLMRSDIEHRSDAVIDQLTGLFNRKGLSVRVLELAQQSRLTGEPVGVIVGDIDHFKRVNDTLGHAAGDAVLQNVAYLVRKRLRAFDLAYRLGGEEFVVLLPGSDLGGSAELAERLREAVSADELGAARITMSFGVGASGRGEAFEYDSVFAQADSALYRAKQNGRDQVCCTESDGGPAPVLASMAAAHRRLIEGPGHHLKSRSTRTLNVSATMSVTWPNLTTAS
jgi:diguanylate cyclase (GGDEF)-like protein